MRAGLPSGVLLTHFANPASLRLRAAFGTGHKHALGALQAPLWRHREDYALSRTPQAEPCLHRWVQLMVRRRWGFCMPLVTPPVPGLLPVLPPLPVQVLLLVPALAPLVLANASTMAVVVAVVAVASVAA